MSMNAAVNATTKCSPYFAMRGEHYNLTVPKPPQDRTRMFDPLGYGMNLCAEQIKIRKCMRHFNTLLQCCRNSNADIKLIIQYSITYCWNIYNLFHKIVTHEDIKIN